MTYGRRGVPQEERLAFIRDWHAGMPLRALAEKYSLSIQGVHSRRKDWDLPPRRGGLLKSLRAAIG